MMLSEHLPCRQRISTVRLLWHWQFVLQTTSCLWYSCCALSDCCDADGFKSRLYQIVTLTVFVANHSICGGIHAVPVRMSQRGWFLLPTTDCYNTDSFCCPPQTVTTLMVFVALHRLLQHWWFLLPSTDCYNTAGFCCPPQTVTTLLVCVALHRLLQHW